MYKVPQSCLTLCDPTDYSPPGSSVHGILQARILEWVAMPASLLSPAWAGGFFTTSATWEAQIRRAIIFKKKKNKHDFKT